MALGIREKGLKGLGRLAAYWGAGSDLERLVAAHQGDRLFKWRHYYEVYERHFGRRRGRPITLLEIGVANGGSLALWRKYFGPQAQLVGVDIEPDCRQYAGPGVAIAIGSQGDPEFLRRLAAEHGPFDIVIDDGSHIYEHQRVTFETLFPHIKADGLYVCEDLHTSYRTDGEFGGGLRRPGTFVEFLKEQIDELNAWFWREKVEEEPHALARVVHGIHFYPTLVVIEKRPSAPPVVAHVGSRLRRRL
ncbi:MAG: class I SAM-dependent methyltransferase [Caulobacteraceae bacterium]|nr:class I SAM-dependent methyltransferase [Caulobacteraceae bacterium]